MSGSVAITLAETTAESRRMDSTTGSAGIAACQLGERHMIRILLSIALLASLSGVAFGQTAPASEIAPGGKLRVGMIAVTVLGGVAEPVARFIGQKLVVPPSNR